MTHRIIIFLLFVAIAIGQGEQSKDLVLVDEFRSLPCDDLLSRLDSLAFQATDNKSVGLVVLYPGKDIFQAEWYERSIRNNSRFRGFPDGLIRVIKSTRADDLRFELWRTTSEKPHPFRDMPLEYRLPMISSRTLAVDDSLEVFEDEGKLNYASGQMCGGEFSLDVLAKILAANPEISGEIVVYNRKSSEARKLSRLIMDAALSESGIQKSRLRMVLGGSGKAKNWSPTVSAVEVWLVPSKQKSRR